MNPQENQVLQDFLDQLAQVRGVAKDPQADALIAKAVAQQPDAAYLLVQRALLQEQALNAAKAQIAALQNQVQAAQPASTRSFLSADNRWGNSAGSAQRPAEPTAMPGSSQYATPNAPAFSANPRPGFLGGGAGGFLGSMAATAAGVAGGAFLFQGIENLLGHHGAGAAGQQGLASSPPENTSTNDSADNTLADNSDMAADAGIDDISGSDDGSSV
jgi:hypothetical protein